MARRALKGNNSPITKKKMMKKMHGKVNIGRERKGCGAASTSLNRSKERQRPDDPMHELLILNHASTPLM